MISVSIRFSIHEMRPLGKGRRKDGLTWKGISTPASALSAFWGSALHDHQSLLSSFIIADTKLGSNKSKLDEENTGQGSNLRVLMACFEVLYH